MPSSCFAKALDGALVRACVLQLLGFIEQGLRRFAFKPVVGGAACRQTEGANKRENCGYTTKRELEHSNTASKRDRRL